MKNKKNVSVIIPTYNEEKVIANCLRSLKDQTYKDIEIIVVDDGSKDSTLKIISNLKSPFRLEARSRRAISNLKVLYQKHQGPGPARNLGANSAKGEILVFVDADMTFDKNFLKDLTKPILEGKTIGTFSKNEMNANWQNIWSACWNINRNWPSKRLIPSDYPNRAPVFRAILKKEFDKVGGFDATGEYTDDWSLSRKLKRQSTLAKGATYYHSNPDNLKEVFKQARWIGKNGFISGSSVRRFKSLIFYSPALTVPIAIYRSIVHLKPEYIIFKVAYDSAVFISVLKSFFNESKAK